jgi:hypothetical protein
MPTCTQLKPPNGLSDIPEDNVWIHTHVLSTEYFGVVGLAVYSIEELAKLVFPDWSDPVVKKTFKVIEIPFEEAREIAKTTLNSDGEQLIAVHIHDESPMIPSRTHWVD